MEDNLVGGLGSLEQSINNRLAFSAPQQGEVEVESDDVDISTTEEVTSDSIENQHDSTITEKQAKFKSDKEENIVKLREKSAAEIKKLKDEANYWKQEAAKKNQMNDEDIVEGKHYNAQDKKIRELEEKVMRREMYDQQQHEMNQLKNSYTDFDRVVNKQTLAKLEKTDPIAFNAVNKAPDLLSGGAAAYRIIQSMGLADAEDNAERMDRNISKPSVGRTPSNLSRMNSFSSVDTPEEKAAYFAYVNKLAKGG